VGFVVVKGDARQRASPRQYGVTEGEASQRCGIEIGKGMEGVPFQACAFSGDIEKAGIEVGVVPNQYGSVALIGFHREPDDTEKLPEGDGLG
jgi:hypothetical protein